MEYSLKDIVFELDGVIVAFVHDYANTGWPGLVVQFPNGGDINVIKAPLSVMHAVQMCSFSFSSIVKKLDDQDHRIEELKARFDELSKPQKEADVIPFKPREV